MAPAPFRIHKYKKASDQFTSIVTTMNKTALIIRREYFTRLRKPSFWVLTLLVPLLAAALYAVPIMLASRPTQHDHILVVDDSGLFQGQFRSSRTITYHPAASLDYAKRQLAAHDSLAAILFIPAREVSIPQDAFLYYSSDAPSLAIQSDANSQLQEILRNCILLDVHGISAEDYTMLTSTRLHLRVQDIATGREAYLPVKIALGTFFAILLFLAVFLFGSQVMRGVAEEKSNRIVEVILGSVRPLQLMMGKIVGIALVGLTQFALWLFLSAAALGGIRAANAPLFQQVEASRHISEVATKGDQATAQYQHARTQAELYQAGVGIDQNLQDILHGLSSINYPMLLPLLLLYFLLGYILYAALFAAAGSLVDSETDSQPFIIPITLPLLFALLLLPLMIRAPSGSLSLWLSIIPFTSSVAMLFRLPFGVPLWQFFLSLGLLVVTIPLTTYLAARIYRGAILRYGQKPASLLRKILRGGK